jgi:hypothetical protein
MSGKSRYRGLKQWKAQDSVPGVRLQNFPAFRVTPATLEAFEKFCTQNNSDRPLVMRSLLHLALSDEQFQKQLIQVLERMKSVDSF